MEWRAGLTTQLYLNNIPLYALQKAWLILISLLVKFVMFLGTAGLLVWSAQIMVLMCSQTLIRVSVSLVLCLSILLSIIMGLLMGFVRKGLSIDLSCKSLITQGY